jgi:propanol-preferring alcohol dehydrogenase
VVISLGTTDEPIELSAYDLLFKQLGVDGALTGTPAAGDATLRFSALSDVAAMVETMPLERAPEAYAVNRRWNVTPDRRPILTP